MTKRLILNFALHWLVSASGLWLCFNLFAKVNNPSDFWLFASAGLIFSILNSIFKPIIKILSLPLIIFSLGLFSLVINGAIIALTVWLVPGVQMSFGAAILSSILMSIINGLVNFLVPSYNK